MDKVYQILMVNNITDYGIKSVLPDNAYHKTLEEAEFFIRRRQDMFKAKGLELVYKGFIEDIKELNTKIYMNKEDKNIYSIYIYELNLREKNEEIDYPIFI